MKKLQNDLVFPTYRELIVTVHNKQTNNNIIMNIHSFICICYDTLSSPDVHVNVLVFLFISVALIAAFTLTLFTLACVPPEMQSGGGNGGEKVMIPPDSRVKLSSMHQQQFN